MRMFENVKLQVHTDSTAAKSITTRYGGGRNSKHIQLRYLYVQDLVQDGLLTVKKVCTTQNPAGCFTTHVDSTTLLSHVATLGLNIRCKPEGYDIFNIKSKLSRLSRALHHIAFDTTSCSTRHTFQCMRSPCRASMWLDPVVLHL